MQDAWQEAIRKISNMQGAWQNMLDKCDSWHFGLDHLFDVTKRIPLVDKGNKFILDTTAEIWKQNSGSHWFLL